VCVGGIERSEKVADTVQELGIMMEDIVRKKVRRVLLHCEGI
jgi:hypothetical protein